MINQFLAWIPIAYPLKRRIMGMEWEHWPEIG